LDRRARCPEDEPAKREKYDGMLEEYGDGMEVKQVTVTGE